MKKLLYKLTILFSMVILLSCSEDFLVREPISSLAEPVFYNEKGLDALLVGTYAIISNSYQAGFRYAHTPANWIHGSVAADDGYKGSDAGDIQPVHEMEIWNTLPTNVYNTEKWIWAFNGVTRANNILRIVKGTTDIIPARKVQVEAEARFLRAFFNFEAWLVYKNIPIITEETADPKKVPNDVDILPHIIADLTFAMNNLPANQAVVARPTKYAAMAVAARAYMQELMYSEAKPLLDNIIGSGKYSLMTRYHDNFRIPTENNAESIYELQHAVNDGANQSTNGTSGYGLSSPIIDFVGNSHAHQTSQNLVNAFKVDSNGLPMHTTFNDVDLKNDMGISSTQHFEPTTDEVDPRLDWTTGRRGIPFFDWGVYRGMGTIKDQGNGGPYSPSKKHYFYKSEVGIYSTTTGFAQGVNANNFRLYRLSHILLWRAEIHAFENELAQAEALVNQIRNRAGNQVVMGKITTYVLPPSVMPFNLNVDFNQPAANYKVLPYPAGTFASQGKAYAIRAIQWENRLEFGQEGLRFFDLRRWDKLPAELNSMPMIKTLNDYAQNDLRIRTIMTGAVFTEKSKYWPIPQSQIDLQPGVLKQNPGY
jgi:starch-binding outer membrane protein, SusD/RagB family